MSLFPILPPTDLFLPFLVAAIAVTLTPGADMTFVALSGARGGRRAGLAAAAGIFAGCLGHILFAVVGLSALIAASQTAFAAVKWLGVAYLVYLAVQLLRDERRTPGDDRRPAPTGLRRSFRKAAVVNLLNPKVGIFFLAFLPQFISPDAAAPWLQILVLGLLFNVLGLLVNAAVALGSAATASRIGGHHGFRRASRWFAATVMGGLALKLALARND